MTYANSFTTAYLCHAMGYAHDDEPAPCIYDYLTDEPVEDETLDDCLSLEAEAEALLLSERVERCECCGEGKDAIHEDDFAWWCNDCEQPNLK